MNTTIPLSPEARQRIFGRRPAPPEPTDAELSALWRLHGQQHIIDALRGGIARGELGNFDSLKLFVELLRPWGNADPAAGWIVMPQPGDTGMDKARPYGRTPRPSWWGAPPCADRNFTPWLRPGVSAVQEICFRTGAVELGAALVAGFAEGGYTPARAEMTLANLSSDVNSLMQQLCFGLGDTITPKEAHQIMDDITVDAFEFSRHWTDDGPDAYEEEMAFGRQLQADLLATIATVDSPPAQPGEQSTGETVVMASPVSAVSMPDLDGRLVGADTLLSTPVPPADPMLEGVFDLGDKVALLGSSKSRKSFYFIQLALCLATGRDFLGMRIPHRRRVLFVNLELKDAHFHRRLARMARGLGIVARELHGQFFVFNARGLAIPASKMLGIVQGMLEANGTEIVFLDPLYKLAEGDENSARDMKPVLAGFDRLATETGAAVAYSHHDAKGSPGDRNIRDRGAGSNVIGRDYDAAVTLTPHRFEEGAVVVEFLCRNYKSPDRLAVRFDEEFCVFRPATDLVPEGVTSKPPREQQNGEKWRDHFEAAVTLALEQAWLKGEFTAALAKRFELSGVQVEKLYRAVRDDERIYTDKGPNKGVTPRHFIGPEAAVTQRIKALKTQGDLGNGK